MLVTNQSEIYQRNARLYVYMRYSCASKSFPFKKKHDYFILMVKLVIVWGIITCYKRTITFKCARSIRALVKLNDDQPLQRSQYIIINKDKLKNETLQMIIQTLD